MNTQIILNDIYKLDITEDISLQFTYQCGDIRNILSKNSSYSKSLSIKGTANNNIAFGNLFDVSNYSDFNPNKKASVIVISGGIKIFEGYLKIDSIKIANRVDVTYECTMYSNVADFFTELANLKLNNLSFAEFNHTYTKENVIGSWDSHIIYNGQETPARKGFGYVYPYFDFGNDASLTKNKYTEFFKPAFYAKTILDKIFEQTDYTYKSEFFSSDYFKSLVIVSSPSAFQISDTIFNDSKLWASQESNSTDVTTVIDSYVSNTQLIAISDGSLFSQIVSPLNKILTGNLYLPNTVYSGRYDYGENFDTTSFVYKVPKTGYYNIVSNFNLDFKISNNKYGINSPIPTIDVSTEIKFICSISVTGGTLNQYGHYPIYNIENQTIDRVYTDTVLVHNDIPISSFNGETNNFDFNSGVPHLLNEGDKVCIQITCDFKLLSLLESVRVSDFDFEPRLELIQVSPSDLKIELVDNLIHEGMDWNFSLGQISSDQCSDYIQSLSKMFNLYFENDTENQNTLIIEPRSKFYNGYIIDWTGKLDRTLEYELTPMSDLTSKKLHFLYRNDSDYWNDKYQKENLSTNRFSLLSQLTYGELTYYFDNDFIDQHSECKCP